MAIRLKLLEASFGISVEDVWANGCVYAPDFGVFITPDPAKVTRAEYKAKIRGQRTTLEKVREMPDQPFEHAQATLLDPNSTRDPILLSLACDNAKVVVQRNGVLEVPKTWSVETTYEMTPQFGLGENEGLRRHLDERWMPIPVITAADGGAVYTERAFVAPFGQQPAPGSPNEWLSPKPLGVVEFSVQNPTTAEVYASLSLSFTFKDRRDGTSEYNRTPFAELRQVPTGVVVTKQQHLFAWADTRGMSAWNGEVKDHGMALSGRIPAGGKARCFVAGTGDTDRRVC